MSPLIGSGWKSPQSDSQAIDDLSRRIEDPQQVDLYRVIYDSLREIGASVSEAYTYCLETMCGMPHTRSIEWFQERDDGRQNG